MEVDERRVALHRQAQADVLVMLGAHPAVPIAEQAIVADRVVMRAGPAPHDGHCRDVEGDLSQDARLEHPLRPQEGNALAFVDEAFGGDLARQAAILAGEPLLLLKETERRQSSLRVVAHRP